MKIGIRVKPTGVTFAILSNREIINVEDILVPRALETPDALKYIRNNILDILREYKVQAAGIRSTEPSAQSHSIERIQIEGVIQEAFASSSLKRYYIGQIASITSRLRVDRIDFKKMIKGQNSFGIDGWSEFKSEEREAILCGIGA